MNWACWFTLGSAKVPSRPRTEEEKARHREEQRHRYWSDPDRHRAAASERGKRQRAVRRDAGLPPKPRVRKPTEEQKAAAAAAQREKYWEDPDKYRAKARERDTRRRTEGRDAVNESKRTYYRKNRQQILASQRAALATTVGERRRAAARARTDPVENRARVKAWRHANPVKVREIKLRRRARLANAPVNDFTAEQWLQLLAEFEGRCAYCPATATTQDHLIPLSRGGAHTASNIVPACLRCNSSKGARTFLEFLLLESRAAAEDGEAA
jgi:5-methylcytosine-specific restriction endonuclease McrA